jgi:hypothetical protein
MRRFANAEDGNPKAEQAYAKLKKTWDAAPIVKSMIGKKVRILGYVVPLDGFFFFFYLTLIFFYK